MSESSNGSIQRPPALDERDPFGMWRDNAKWRDDLCKKASFKSLDIPEDDVNINSGNTHHHYHDPAHAPAPEKRSDLGTLAKVAIGAGLLATGAGIPIGASFIADAIKNMKPSAPITGSDVDRDWGIKILPNEEK